jgi:hypothetical protein
MGFLFPGLVRIADAFATRVIADAKTPSQAMLNTALLDVLRQI